MPINEDFCFLHFDFIIACCFYLNSFISSRNLSNHFSYVNICHDHNSKHERKIIKNIKTLKNVFLCKILGSASSGINIQPLNTLLELLTGKISLNEIDFNLLIEATQATLECNDD